MNTEQAVAIIGAGPAGLSMGRALAAQNIAFVIFEAHHQVGGIWDVEHAGSPMYDSAHFISSKNMSGHYGFPMPESYPDYPSNRQILQYIQRFSEQYQLNQHIRFNTKITQAELVNEQWQLTTEQGEQHTFGWLVCANGTNWHPNRPTLKGEDAFSGKVLHAVEYRKSTALENKKVVVVGAGNSGVDIACDAAFMADEAYISLRRGYHFVPKHVFGVPADEFGARSNWVPLPLQQRSFGLLLKLLNGDLTRLNLPKPDHKIFASHPILNTQILHYLQHGDLHAKPDIDYLDGDRVHFVDQSQVQADLVILATGYQWRIPYLNDQYFQWKHHRPETFMKVFNPSIPNLFINGFIETNGGAYKLFDDMAHLIALTIDAQKHDPHKAKKIESMINGPEPDLGGGVGYVQSDRHQGYTNTNAYRKAMKWFRKQLEWPELV